MLAAVAIAIAILALALAGHAASRARALEERLERERSRDAASAPRIELRDVVREGDELVLSLVNVGGGVAREVASLLAVRDREVKHPDRVELRPLGAGHAPVQLRCPVPDGAGDGGPAFSRRLKYEGPAGPERAAIGYQPGE